MNIVRQYKLYRLGVVIPPSSLEIIKFLEEVFSKIVRYKNTNFYVDANDKNKVYLQDQKNDIVFYRNEGFGEILKNKYNLDYHERQDIIKIMIARFFKMDNKKPQ